MYKLILDDSHSEYDIYINTISSVAGHYLSRRPHVYAIIRELLMNANKMNGQRVVIEKNMGRDIGTTDVVTTSEKDTIYYAQPVKSNTYSRFAKNRYPQASSILTVVFNRDKDGNYEVVDTWIGSKHPAFPGDKYETDDSKEYWQMHALVQDAQPVKSRSITKTCPY